MEKMTKERQEFITSRMLSLRGFTYKKGAFNIDKWEIAHSNFDIEKVINNKTFIKTKPIKK